MAMITVELNSVSAHKGDIIRVHISASESEKYGQTQLEVFGVAVLNPISKLGFGTSPTRIGKCTVEVSIDASHLDPGFVEMYDPLGRFVYFESHGGFSYESGRKRNTTQATSSRARS